MFNSYSYVSAVGLHVKTRTTAITKYIQRLRTNWERKFQGANVPGSEYSPVRKFQGAKVPGPIRSGERKFQGARRPRSEKAGERKGQGAKVPGNELARVLLADSLQGVNWPGSEKAVNLLSYSTDRFLSKLPDNYVVNPSSPERAVIKCESDNRSIYFMPGRTPGQRVVSRCQFPRAHRRQDARIRSN